MQVKKQQLELDMDQWTGSKLAKEYIKAVYCHLAYLTLYSEYITWNARLDEAQVGIKIARRNINNLRYADDTNLMAESEEELRSLLMKVKEESKKAGLKLNIQKMKIVAAAAAKSLQSCPTLCNPRDGSPPGSSIPGILQAILIPACTSSSPAFCMMYSAYKLNKQGDNI